MINILNDIALWLLVASAEGTIGTFIYRKVAGTWWWQKQIKQPWNFTISSEGWSFSAQDFNPLETARKAIAHILGNDKTFEDILKNRIEEYLKVRAKNSFIDEEEIYKIFEEKFKKMIDEYLKKK